MQVRLRILGRDVDLECGQAEERRLVDLAAALEARLSRLGDVDDVRRLVRASLALMDEAQTTAAALARARMEIERLTDMLVEARLAAAEPRLGLEDQRDRVTVLHGAQGSA